jgi:TP901-1 family phage major tail protein
MAAQKGSLVLIKRSGTTIAAQRISSLSINNEMVDITNKDSSGMRELLDGGGIQSMSMSCSGVFSDDATQESVRADAVANSLNTYSFVTEDGGIFSGSWLITSYERAGEHNGEETWSMTFESSGAITYTP